MASMFKKPKRNFRKKIGDFDSDNENDVKNENVDVSAGVTTVPFKQTKDKKKQDSKDKDSRSKTVLSFALEEDDGEGEVFKIKKSSHSRRIAKQIKRERKEKNGTGDRNFDDDDDDDSDDTVSEGVNRRRRREEEEQARAEDELRKLREEIKTLNGEEAEGAESSDEDDDDQKAFKNRLARGEIPDAKMIHFIRKKRQMARESENFIPIEEVDPKTSKTATARLVRDDDNDKSDDEEDARVVFSVDKAAIERQQMRDDFLAAEHGSDVDSDHDGEWEKQQIRKAVSLQIPGIELPSAANSNDSSTTASFLNTLSIADGRYGFQSGGAAHEEQRPFLAVSKLQTSSDITIESVRKCLQERLDVMDTVYRGHKMEFEKIVFDIAEAKENISSSEQKAPDLESRYRFFQELRGYVRDLVECLNEKVPTIIELEDKVNSLLKARADRFLKRRQQDVQDQCRDYMTSTAHVKVDIEAREEHTRQRRAAEREARRARRRRAREAKNIVGHHDGMSSDDEEGSQSVVVKFKSDIEEVMRARDALFVDVVEDFSEIDSVKEQFERWKYTFGDSYREAYIGLCLPKLLTPLIRRDLLLWNPLEEYHSGDFEECHWFNCLVFFGYREGEEEETSDDDQRILPSIVEKLIIPKLTFLVEHVWDPLSTTQTSRLVNLTQRLVRDYPTVHALNKHFRAYMEAVVARLKKTLDDDVFMPMYPLSVLDNRSSGPAVFFHRQSWTCIKLLGNLLSWHQLIAAPVLQKLALSGLLNRYIVVGLVSSHINREALQKCQTIISTFPKDWFTNLEGDSTLPQLENLCRYLVSAARTLHKATAMDKDNERLEGRELVKQISKHLVNIHAMDHAMSLANEFSFKIS